MPSPFDAATQQKWIAVMAAHGVTMTFEEHQVVFVDTKNPDVRQAMPNEDLEKFLSALVASSPQSESATQTAVY